MKRRFEILLIHLVVIASFVPALSAQRAVAVQPAPLPKPVGCVEQMQALADTFVAHPQNAGLFDGAHASFVDTVSAVDTAVTQVVDNAAFISYPPEPFNVYRLDSASIPDPETLAAARQEYGDYVAGIVAQSDCLVNIDWFASNGDVFNTLGVAASDGSPKLEPLSDMVLDASQEVNTFPVATVAAPPTGRQTQVWKNLIGVTKAWGSVSVSALGADGCNASFTASFTSSSAFPFVVEPPTATPAVTITCFPKDGCTCKGHADKMECGQVSQPYSVIARIGTQWFGADLKSYSGTVKAWACADGQAGAGNF